MGEVEDLAYEDNMVATFVLIGRSAREARRAIAQHGDRVGSTIDRHARKLLEAFGREPRRDRLLPGG